MAAAMKSYEVTYERDESGWWLASVPRVKGCQTQGRTIEEARRRIREALGLFVDGADKVELADVVRLPLEARRAVEAAKRARGKLQKAQCDVQEATCAAARVLVEETGLSLRDVGHLLGISFQRAHQLRQEVVTRRAVKRGA
jgi:predicted RNase H-like HicB family nuclease